MIYLYSGTPGSGKTLHAVARIWAYVKRNRRAVANIRLNTVAFKDKADYFMYVRNRDLTPDFLIQLSRDTFYGRKPEEDSILVVIDEAQNMFNSRQWQGRAREKWIEFFTQHRKYGYIIILISQYDRMLDKQLRNLIEFESKHRRMDRLPFPWGLLLRLFKGGAFYVRKGWYPLKGMKVDEETVHFPKKVFDIYDTFAVVEADGGAEHDSVSEKSLEISSKKDVSCVPLRPTLAQLLSAAESESGRVHAGGSGRDNGIGGFSDGVGDISVHDGRKPDGGGVDAGQLATSD